VHAEGETGKCVSTKEEKNRNSTSGRGITPEGGLGGNGRKSRRARAARSGGTGTGRTGNHPWYVDATRSFGEFRWGANETTNLDRLNGSYEPGKKEKKAEATGSRFEHFPGRYTRLRDTCGFLGLKGGRCLGRGKLESRGDGGELLSLLRDGAILG